MKEAIIYLDSSIIIKRYVKEPGSESVRNIFLKTYSGELTLTFSSWNIGEVLGALDRAMVQNRLSKEKHAISKKRFLFETRRLIKLGRLMLIPIRIRILSESWKLIEKYHIHQADALQIASAKNVNASQFLVSDKKLHEIAEMENLNSVYIS